MAKKTTKSEDTLVEVVLPHQEVLADLAEKGTLDRKADLDQQTKMTIGRIDAKFKKGVELGDEKMQQAAENESKELANVLLEFARAKAEKEGQANEFNNLVEQGDACMASNDMENARGFYNQAFTINPTDAHVQGQLALIEERATAAIVETENQAKVNEHHENALAFMKEGKLQEARAEYEQALLIVPDSQELLDHIAQIDAHLANDTGVGTISNSSERLVNIMEDIEKHIQKQGKISHQELLDIGLTRYPTKNDEFTIGKQDRDGKTLTLVKVEEGIYKVKESPKKKTNWGLIAGIGIGIAALVGAIVYASTGKKK